MTPSQEKEFDEKFTYGVILSASSDLSAGTDIRLNTNYHPNEIKKFISRLLHEERERVREDIIEKVRNLSKKNLGSREYKEIWIKWDDVLEILSLLEQGLINK